MSRKTPLDGAERKGREAFRAGLPQSACPYEDKRKWCGRLTWSRAFIRAWEHGWQDEQRKTVTPVTPRGGEPG